MSTILMVETSPPSTNWLLLEVKLVNYLSNYLGWWVVGSWTKSEHFRSNTAQPASLGKWRIGSGLSPRVASHVMLCLKLCLWQSWWFISFNLGGWKEDVIQDTFLLFEANKILSIYIASLPICLLIIYLFGAKINLVRVQ